MVASRLSEDCRWRIVDLYLTEHMSMRSIAKTIKCSPQTVHNIILLYKTTHSVKYRPVSGRPSILSPSDLSCLDKAIKRNPNAKARELKHYLQNTNNLIVSLTTLKQARKNLGYHSVLEKIVQELKPIHKQQRLTFVTSNCNTNWKVVCFSDEKLFTLDATRDKVWIKRGSAIPKRTVKQFRSRIMVWGCVWYFGRSTLCFTNEKINATKYQKILTDHLLPSMPSGARYQFQQDNAPCHKAKTTIEWLSTYAVPVLPNWPPYSPDLNPIESVWSWMTNYVKDKQPTSTPELKAAIQHAWDDIPQTVIQAYIDKVPTTCLKIKEVHGDRPVRQ